MGLNSANWLSPINGTFHRRRQLPFAVRRALVLGANLGTAINPVLEGVSGHDAAARRPAMGNLLNRVSGVVIALALLNPIGRFMASIEPDNARVVADFHTSFNLILAILVLPLLTPYAALLR
jgi:phosphate:Na+ symporter